jgi:hypothetical protein
MILILPSLTTLRPEVWLYSELGPVVGNTGRYFPMASDLTRILMPRRLRLMTERRRLLLIDYVRILQRQCLRLRCAKSVMVVLIDSCGDIEQQVRSRTEEDISGDVEQ